MHKTLHVCRCVCLLLTVILVTSFSSCSKKTDEENDVSEASPTQAVYTVDENNLMISSSDEESVVPVDSENSVLEIDGRNLKETIKKLFPESGIHGSGPIGDEKNIVEIRDIKGMLIATLEDEADLIPVENGIIYTGRERNGEKSMYSYYLYDFDSKGTTLLGSVEGIFRIMSYDNMYIGNKLYTLLVDRDYNSFLCIMDTKELTFKKVALGTNKCIFCSMTYFDGFVYYYTADTIYTEAIYRYDPGNEEIIKIRDYAFDAENFTGDTLLHLATDTDYLYVLKAESKGKNSSRLFADMYDNKLDLVKRTELTDKIHEFNKDRITEEIYGKEEAEQRRDDAIRKPVYGFEVRNGVLYYEAQGGVRLLEEFAPGNSSDSKNIPQMNADMLGARSLEITNGEYCFFDINIQYTYPYDPCNSVLQKSQYIYLYDPYNSVLQKSQLIINGETKEVWEIRYGRGGKLLINGGLKTDPLSEIKATFYYVDKTELSPVE